MSRPIVLKNKQHTALGLSLHFIKGVPISFDEEDVKYSGVILAMEGYGQENPFTHYVVILSVEHCPNPVRFLAPVRPSTNVLSREE